MDNAMTYTAEKSLREKVLEALKDLKMTKQELAMRIQYSRPAVSQYLNNKYKSDSAELEAKLSAFVASYEAGKGIRQDAPVPAMPVMDAEPVGAAVPVPLTAKPKYFESRDYMQVIGVCRSCQQGGALGIIVAKSGFGKTHTLRRYAELPRVVYIEGNETMNCKDIVRRIEGKIGMQRSYGSIDERVERIIDFFNINDGYLLIMDEADKLINKYTVKKIELLRSISDGANVGLVLAGETALEPLLKTYDARFANRMDFYYKLRGLNEKEVRAYLAGYDTDADAMGEFIRRATNTQTGCFRLLDRTLSNVIRILKENGETRITMKTMSQASNMMML